MGVADVISGLVNNFKFHNVWVTIIMTFLVIGGIGFGLFWLWNKKIQYKYNFEIIDSQGNSTFVKAKIIKTDQNIRKFSIIGYERPEQWISISLEPTRIINGTKYRQVAFDGKGNLVATEGFKLHKENYIETSLTEVEKTIQAYAIMEANKDHNILDKSSKYLLGGLAVLCVFMFMMLFFEVKGVIQIGESAENTAQTISVAASKLVNVAESMDRRTRMEEILYKQVYGGNFSLELPAK